jgi:hypothetical protein
MACSAVAATPVTALRLPPHKLPQLLDPLTLRLLERLRPQQGAAVAGALLAERDAAAECVAAAAAHRAAVLASAYSAGSAKVSDCAPAGGAASAVLLPATLQRGRGGAKTTAEACGPLPGAYCSEQTSMQPEQRRPRWQTARRAACKGAGGRLAAAAGGGASGGEGQEMGEAAWEGGLPRGFTQDKCACLPGTSGSSGAASSLKQLVAAVQEVDRGGRRADAVQQKLLRRRWLTSSTRARQPQAAGSSLGSSSSCRPAGASDVGPDGSAPQPEALASHTTLLESAIVVVLDLEPLPGQLPAPEEADALVVAVDDAAAKFSAAVHDAGLRLVRWSPLRYVLLAELPSVGGASSDEDDEGAGDGAGGARRATAAVAAACVLSMRRQLAAVVARSPCVHMRLCAGLGVGSCFLECEGGCGQGPGMQRVPPSVWGPRCRQLEG